MATKTLPESVRGLLVLVEELWTDRPGPVKAAVADVRKALGATDKKMKVARQAAVASGRSGRPRQHDEAKRRAIAAAVGSVRDVAGQFGVSENLVRVCRKEFPNSL